ncbi:DUF3574 domain-containing protein [Lysobacter yangpyeongensis]|uniref:DUF3574 domain-containing protein n=1 Tax=Lysobacter yangpyeongensis TaxID=346182 RepID=A0ABW0SRM0_9GAMM
MNARAARAVLVVAVAAATAGCASLRESAAASRCAADAQSMVQETLYFGTQTPDGSVTPAQWSQFLAETVTPRFPQGLSVWPASGQWRGTDGSIAREASYVLTLLHGDDPASDAAVRAIADDYRRRFRQEAVMRVRAPACVSF